jgi:hypothetical protein
VHSGEAEAMITDLATQPYGGFHDLLSPLIRSGGELRRTKLPAEITDLVGQSSRIKFLASSRPFSFEGE